MQRPNMDEDVALAWEMIKMQPTLEEYIYRQAVEKLLFNLDQLPGAFCVRVPATRNTGYGLWQDIVCRTVALHECGIYRLAVPRRDRTDFLLPSQPEITEIKESADVYAVPWGGSAYSAYLKLEVKRGVLIEERWPFVDLSQNARRKHGIQSSARHISLSQHGDGTIHDVVTSVNGVTLPICRIVKEGKRLFALTSMATTTECPLSS